MYRHAFNCVFTLFTVEGVADLDIFESAVGDGGHCSLVSFSITFNFSGMLAKNIFVKYKMTSTLRSFALPVNGATALSVSGGAGTNGNPYSVFVDMRYNTVFTLDLTPINFPSPNTNIVILFDTRSSAAVQNTGKIITIIITGFSDSKVVVNTHYTSNFGVPGSYAGSAPLGALDQINTISRRNTGLGDGGSAITLISNGTKFVWIGSAGFD
jgi:hypothetical protein